MGDDYSGIADISEEENHTPGLIEQGITGPSHKGVGGQYAPMTYGQYWSTFANDPHRQQNLGAIQGMQDQMLQGYGPGGSSLAGITTLGATQNVGPIHNAQAATVDTGQSQNLMGGQVQNINALNAQAQGQGPSVAAEAARQQGEAATRAQMAALGSQRGAANSALGIRSAQDSAAMNRQGIAANAAMGRAQEAMAARQQLGGALAGATQQAQQGAQAQAQFSQQAGLQNATAANAAQSQNASAANQSILQQGQMNQQVELANLQARLQAGQINNSEYNAQVQATMSQNNNDWGAQMAGMNAMMNENTQLQGVYHGVTAGQANPDYQLTGAGISGGASALGSLATLSDERVKTNVRSESRSAKGFFSQLGNGGRGHMALME